MKPYINPKTIEMDVEAQALICADSPAGDYTGGNPGDAQVGPRFL